jgi:hypothetical protein
MGLDPRVALPFLPYRGPPASHFAKKSPPFFRLNVKARVVYQKFLEIDVSPTSRLRGVFSEGRRILSHSMERQLGPETLPSTAPEDGRLREGSLPCLHHAPDHGLGGVRQAFKNLCCGLLKRPPSIGHARYKKRRQRLKIYEKNF